jgi:hypothetical protein
MEGKLKIGDLTKLMAAQAGSYPRRRRTGAIAEITSKADRAAVPGAS